MMTLADPAEKRNRLAELERAGLVEQHVNPDGKPAMRLTDKGAQLGR